MFRFETNNGCATCDAMDGLYEAEPARPHAYCRCIIYEVDDDLEDDENDDEENAEDDDTDLSAPAHGRSSWSRVGDGWSWEIGDGPIYSEDQDDDGYGESYRVGGTLLVDCCDGKSSTGDDFEMVVHAPDLRDATTREEQDAIMEEAFAEAEAEMIARAYELREADCDPCDPIVS